MLRGVVMCYDMLCCVSWQFSSHFSVCGRSVYGLVIVVLRCDVMSCAVLYCDVLC